MEFDFVHVCVKLKWGHATTRYSYYFKPRSIRLRERSINPCKHLSDQITV